jgi:hypothetical protein
MSAPDRHDADDDALIRYLIGGVPSDEAERLDELSVSDDGVAQRLREVENDLVDDYVRGELTGEVRDRFIAHYLDVPAHREKVTFAEALYARETKSPGTEGPATLRTSAWPSNVPRWGWAIAALLVLAAMGLLIERNVRLQREVAAARDTRAALEQRERDLQGQLSAERTTQAQIAAELARARESLAATEARERSAETGGAPLLSFLLVASTRSIADVPQAAIPRGTREIEVRLLLEADEFPRYRVTLKDPANDRVLWRSPVLASSPSVAGKVVRMRMPAVALLTRHYTFELAGIPAAGGLEVIASYPVAVVLK